MTFSRQTTRQSHSIMLTLFFTTLMCVQTVVALPVPGDDSLSVESTSAPPIFCHPGFLLAVPAVGLAYSVVRWFARKKAQPVQLEIKVEEKLQLYSRDCADGQDMSHACIDRTCESTPVTPSLIPTLEPLRKQSQVPTWFSQKGGVRSKPIPLEGGIPIGEVVKSSS